MTNRNLFQFLTPRNQQKQKKKKQNKTKDARFYDRTSSSFLHIRLKALKMASVVPVMVTILSGQDPSEILIRAPDCKNKNINFIQLNQF